MDSFCLVSKYSVNVRVIVYIVVNISLWILYYCFKDMVIKLDEGKKDLIKVV